MVSNNRNFVKEIATKGLAALLTISPICGKVERLRHHLRKCSLVPPEVQNEVLPPKNDDKENDPPSGPIPSQAGPSNSQTPHPVKKSRTSHAHSMPGPIHVSAAERQKEFSEDVCKVLVSCGIAWNALSNPQAKLFAEKWIPGVVLQDRRIVSGHILDNEVKKVEEKVTSKLMGKMATEQCDGWDNIAKTHVVTSMMTVEHEVSLAAIQILVLEL